MKKKALALLIVLVLCIGMAAPAMAADTIASITIAIPELDGWISPGYFNNDDIVVNNLAIALENAPANYYYKDYEDGYVSYVFIVPKNFVVTTSMGITYRYEISDEISEEYGAEISSPDIPYSFEDIGTNGIVSDYLLYSVEFINGTKEEYSDRIEVEFFYANPERSGYWLDSKTEGYTLRPISELTAAPAAESPSSWAVNNVNTAIEAGLVPDALQSKYTQAATRAEFCALAVALYENVTGSEIAERSTFSDTTDVNVEKMAALGVVNGIGDGKFGPGNKLTREQAATMLSRLAEIIGKPLTNEASTFKDKAEVSSWAVDAVGQMQATGIMGGVGDNTFAPKSDYTREQSIITMLRLFEAVK